MDAFKGLVLQEIFVMRRNLKKYLLLIPLLFLPLVVLKTGENEIIPYQYRTMFLLSLSAIGIASQIAINIFDYERKQGTMQALLASRVKESTIILSKLFVAVFFSLILSLVTFVFNMFIYKICGLNVYLYSSFIYDLVLTLLLSMSSTLLASVLTDDVKLIPYISVLILLLVVVPIGYLKLKLNFPLYIYSIIILLIAILMITYVIKNFKKSLQ